MTPQPTPVPNYFTDLTFDAQSAKQDRILLDIRGWALEGTLDQFNQFSLALSGELDFPEGTRRLFNTRSGTVSWPKWKIAGGEREGGTRLRDGTPLFSGSLGGRSSVHPVARSVWHLHAKLALNPTRWLRSQPYIKVDAANVEEWRQSPVLMFASEAGLRFDGEKSLRRGTNVIIGPRREAMARSYLWPMQLDRYHEAVLATLNDALVAAAAKSGMALRQSELTYSLREIETYWEFKTERPIDEVLNVEMPLRALASKSHVRWRKLAPEALGTVEVGTADNSPVLRLKLSAGTEARIYAKTTRRVRFEVVRKTKQRRESFTAVSPDRFAHWVDDASSHAATALTNLWAAYEEMAAKSSSKSFPRYRLVADIISYLDGKGAAWQIVAQLAQNGRLVRYEGSPHAVHIDRLKAQHVIELAMSSGRDQIYHVTAPYQSGLAAIRDAQ